MFKKLLEQVIHKMLLRDVWGYWFNASLSGSYVDPGRTELRKPWAHPIPRENTTYSGHLLLIIAMRYNDIRDGTNVAEEVLEKYKMAWAKKGMIAESGLYVEWYFVNQDRTAPPTDIYFTAWANAFMNTWNSEIVKNLYYKQALGYITVVDGEKIMWESPWTREYLAMRPWIDGIDLSQRVDTLRGLWDEDAGAVILTLRTWHGSQVTVEPAARNLDPGVRAAYVNGELVKYNFLEERASMSLSVVVGGTDVDIVFQRVCT
ncbi:hypothetical protein VTI74DRAFT_11198 [Chaetomium olivicolor]